jgi:hypothetical protein
VARRISVIIDLVLGGLSIFAQARTNVTAKRHDVEEKVVNQVITVLAFAVLRSWAKISLSSGEHCRAISSSCNMLVTRIDIILLGLVRSAGRAKWRNLNRLFTASAYP